jgi:conjugative transposon TraM protein
MKNVKKRRLLLVLPLLVVPFLTMAFWALGGGSEKTIKADVVKGLNLDLPAANLKEDKFLDKLSFYDQADKDSLKLEEWMRSDPYFKRDTLPGESYPAELQELTNLTANKFNQRLNVSPYEGPIRNPEQKILDKLKLLETEMNKVSSTELPTNYRGSDDLSSDAERAAQLSQTNNTGITEDPEIKQLEGTLDRILDIQHPQRVKERLKEQSLKSKGSAFAVSTKGVNDTIVKGFYSFSAEPDPMDQPSIEAEVHEDQILVNGAVIKFRLLTAIYINGSLIPKGTLVFGIAMLEGERLQVEVESIKCANTLYSVKLDVYDMDGLPGIYIPGAITRDAAKQSADNSLSLLEMTSLDPSIKAQATSTGIGAVKNLLSKKIKLVKVFVKKGYKVLFNNKN